MSLFSGISLPGHPDLPNLRKLDLLAVPFIRRASRLGISYDREGSWELGVKFGHEIKELEKDIASYIPSDRLHEFSNAGDAEGDSEDDYDPRLADADGITPSASPISVSNFNAGSPEQIGRLLYDILGIGAEKNLKRTAAGSISTGKKQLELIKLDHPVVAKVLRHREISKLKSTYTDKLPKLAVLHPRSKKSSDTCPVCEMHHSADTHRIHGEMGVTQAETGRINHRRPNLGNVPTRTEDGRSVQCLFIASPGTRFIKRDLGQIELRDLAHLSMCKSMIDVYLANGDLHDDTCHRALGVPWDVKPDKFKHRMAAKRVNFGIQNGTTEKGLYLQLVMDFGTNGVPIPSWLTEDWCKQFIIDWLESRPEVREFFELCWWRAKRYELAWEPFGRVRKIPEIRSCHSWIKAAGLRQAQNFPVTSLAAGQLKMAMGKMEYVLQQFLANGIWCWPLLTIHDAALVEVDEEYAEEVGAGMGWAMDTVMDDEVTGEHLFRVPIVSDLDITERWETPEDMYLRVINSVIPDYLQPGMDKKRVVKGWAEYLKESHANGAVKAEGIMRGHILTNTIGLGTIWPESSISAPVMKQAA